MILPSVRAFLAGIIDYAGLFPPAKLPLDKAIAQLREVPGRAATPGCWGGSSSRRHGWPN